MGIYIIILITILITGYVLCFCINTKKSVLFFLIFNGIIFICISTFRYGIGFDFKIYGTIFNTIKYISFKDIFLLYHKEIVFILFNKLISSLGGNYMMFLFFTNALITLIVMNFIYRYSNNIFLSVYLYIVLQYYAHSMNLLRQSIAAAILLLAYKHLISNNFYKYVAIIILSSLFHQSALILIPFYFFLRKKITKSSLIIIISATTIIYMKFDSIFFVLTQILFKDYSNYTNSVYWQPNSIKYLIFPLLYLSFVLYNKNKLIEKNPNNLILINSSIFTFAFSLFITKHFVLERFAIYFSVFSLLLIPEIYSMILENAFTNKFKKYVLCSFIITTCFIYFAFAAHEGFHNVYPYRSIFDRVNAKPLSLSEKLQSAQTHWALPQTPTGLYTVSIT